MAYTVRPAKEKLRIVFEGLRAENISELCRHVNVNLEMGNYGHVKVGRSGREKLPPEWT